MEDDGWQPVGTQAQEWLDHMLQQPSTIRLQAIDGTRRKGVTFLYSADIDGSPAEMTGIWLEAEPAPSALPVGDRRLLLMSKK